MRILICVKQVPGSSNVKVDEETGLLIRPKADNKLNPYDLYALETGLAIKDSRDDVILSTITMGPPQAKESLCECIWMGCDEGFLVSDRAFGGADVLATSYTLTQAIEKIGSADLILCGKQTTDGDTAQVGAEMAEHLDIPHLSNVIDILELTDKAITVKALQENMIITERIELPCLLCMDADMNTPRLPSYKRKKSLGDGNITILSFNDMDDRNPEHYGSKGSATQVTKIFPPEKNESRKMYRGTSEELVADLYSLLKTKKFI